MKKVILLLLISITICGTSIAQKYAFVDTEYILTNIPSYKAAQDKLDKISEEYQKEVEALYEEIDEMYKEYQAEKVLLTEEMKAKKEEAIVEKEKKAKKLQHDYFGTEGMLFKKREELVKPIQDEVYKAIKDISQEDGYAIIFDSASGTSILYTNPRYDISDEILERLGYKN